MQAQVYASTSKLPLSAGSGVDDVRDHGAPAQQMSAKAAGKARARSEDHAPSHQASPPQTWQQVIKSGVAGGLAACLAKTSVGTEDLDYLGDAIGPAFVNDHLYSPIRQSQDPISDWLSAI